MNIRPYEKNAKKHSPKQIEHLASIVKEVGWRQPVLVNQKGFIVAGHGRWETWLKFGEKYGLKEIWVMDDKGNTIMGKPEEKVLSKKQETAYRIADNKVSEGDWDMELLIEDMKDLDMDTLILTGFDLSKLSDDFSNLGKSNKEVDIDGVSSKLVHTCPRCKFQFSK